MYLYFISLRGKFGGMPLNLRIGPMALFAFVAWITPGPNNLLLMRSGARFGVRPSVPHLLGIQLGFLGLLLMSWLGLGAMMLALPAAFIVLRWACFIYLLWLAAMILREATAVPAAATAARIAQPIGWLEAAAFQTINAKAWMMSITVASAFYGHARATLPDVAAAALICCAIGLPSMLAWNTSGATIERALRRPAAHRSFNVAMSLLVLATAVWMLV